MPEDFGESVSPTATIRSICGSYPFSIGLFREIIQNSDDARAQKQVFVLDRRSHGTGFLYHNYLVSTQGPALLAYNDALVQEDDWKALQDIYQSSKKTDTSYVHLPFFSDSSKRVFETAKSENMELGFARATMWACCLIPDQPLLIFIKVTDTPHILSGRHFALLDPKHDFTRAGGVKLNIEEVHQKYGDHLTAFEPLLPNSERGKNFDGTIFRFPLRTSPSPISDRIISPDEISNLLGDFAREELNIALLFLRNVSSIKIDEVGVDGTKSVIASAEINRAPLESAVNSQCETQRVTIRTLVSGSLEERVWRIVRTPVSKASEAEAMETLTRRLGGNPTAALSRHKLSPIVELAFPLDSKLTEIGRLFTYLPLPLRTRFPIHINALFALTASRQNLRNAGELGIVKNSDDHALIEWNRLLFDTYIPKTWAALLEVLVQDRIETVFNAWPSLQAEVESGDYAYWKDMPLRVAHYALEHPVWPVFGTNPPSYQVTSSLLLAEESSADGTLTVLVRAGLSIARIPQYLIQIILKNYTSKIKVLSPEIAYNKLQALTKEIRALNDGDAQTLLAYLLSTSNCHFVVGLPLIPSVSGQKIAPLARTAASHSHVLLDEAQEDLFAAYDPQAIPLKQLTPAIRATLVRQGVNILNLSSLGSSHITAYLNASPFTSQARNVTDTRVHWLNKFWDWVQGQYSNLDFCNPFYLVSTTQGLRRPSETVFDPQSDGGITSILELLGIYVIDPRFNTKARRALKHLELSSNIPSLLRALPSTLSVEFSEARANRLCTYLVRHLPTHDGRTQILTSRVLRDRLRALPIFPVIFPSADDIQPPRRMSIVSSVTVRGVDPSGVPILPQLDSVTYLDLRSTSSEFLQYLEPNHLFPLSVSEMQELMLKHFDRQSLQMQVAFVRYVDSNSSAIPRGILNQLGTTNFVPACDGALQKPKDIVDPRADIAALFPGTSPSLPKTSQAIHNTLVTHLRKLNLLITDLSIEIVRDRIRFITGGQCREPETLARTLISHINSTHLDCRTLYNPPSFSLELEWIPTPQGLKSPLRCRDVSSHSRKTDLFDEVMPLVTPGVSIGYYLRQAFPWDGKISFEVLSQQLIKVLDAARPSYDKVREIVKELGGRGLVTSEIVTLRNILRDRNWVPTRKGILAAVPFALLGGDDIPEVGFHSIDFEGHRYSQVRGFLANMGCTERPSKEAIMGKLRSLSNLAPDGRITQGLIRLLTWLPPLALEERAALFIPARNGTLRPFSTLYYNDIGPKICLVDIDSNALAHEGISFKLASDLGLNRAGLIDSQNQNGDDPDMGEDLMTTIRNRLREYTDSQLLLEFLANASDAGATEFNVLLDEQIGPSNALLSPLCSEFQRVPALVIHNNSVFSDDDFLGILRTGIGGKTGRQDTIGQFGLGALTMFHVTEFAMIVSRDQVLFINPCKAHLSMRRASLRLPLSRIRSLYGDHLAPLRGLFGFAPPDDTNESYSYDGTIFRLPLRSSAQFVNIEPISRKTASLRDLEYNFKPFASDCLLFTALTSIQLFERKLPTKPRLLWSFAAFRGECRDIGKGISRHPVIITCPLKSRQEWRVYSLSIDPKQLPSFIPSLQEKYRLRLPPIIRVAVCSSPKPTHTLFSTLPLPISLNLPVHISASFILASDRRSVRLDEYKNDEASYNGWLLKSAIPTLYLSLLEDYASTQDNAAYWPGNTEVARESTPNVISTMVVDAVYQMVVTSGSSVFKSKFHAAALSPRTAYLMTDPPSSVSKVLKAIEPQDAVQLPPSVTQRLCDVDSNGSISLVAPEYVHRIILDNSSRFSPTILEFERLQELIDYLSKDEDAPSSLIGLQLLPLQDGSFAKFDTPSNPCFYVSPYDVVAKAVFKPHRLVHEDLSTRRLLELDSKLNVSRVKDTNIGTLLNDWVSPSQTLNSARPDTQLWIKKFWKIFTSLDIPITSIDNYPLVPTLRTGCYLSPQFSKASPTVILADFTSHDWLPQCLTQMGFTLIDTTRLQRDLRSELSPPPLFVKSVLAKLFRHPKSISALFDSLDEEARRHFASWIRADFMRRTRGYFNGQHRSLPIWTSTNGSFITANEARMFPSGFTLRSAGPFASTAIVDYDKTLLSMGVQPPSSARSLLDIPDRLGENLDGAYRRLVRALLESQETGSGIPVPNSQRVIRESTSLYSSRDDLFVASFGLQSEHFILLSFRDLEPQFERFGLKTQRDLDITMFKNCVDEFQGALRGVASRNLEARATTIFRIFCEDLPRLADDSTQWATLGNLGNLRFILKNPSPQPLPGVNSSMYMASHVRHLPSIVSPNKLVRKEFAAISWSQRVLYNSEPHQRILMVYPDLSIPTAEEVVNHLVVLATRVAEDQIDNVNCHATLLDHLKQTYTWLNDHAEDAEQYLRQCTDDGIPLFLNVNTVPEGPNDWNWKRADRILLDDYDTGSLEFPRDFIKSFHSLLVVAGAVNINYGQEAEVSSEQSTSEDLLTNLRTSFDQMRNDRTCTDVTFICDPPAGTPLYAHRAYLAAYSTYFRDMFSGSFSEAGNASQAKPIRVRVQKYSRRCVENVLNYAYTAREPELGRENIDLALEMLSLTHFWSMTHAQDVVQNIMKKPKMVDPFNLEQVRSTAEETHSTELVSHCEVYERNNQDLVQLAKDESAETAHN
ncbi:hypothetical protein P691DRAFT_776972 [Macrolepiota fuliginosa MF-IS2]|uniref:BTB domain-containing protein n=1 Tax=Macrolepiota fuliginosa MF-IS2 TaxID=1400762 RepID=A0A9P5X806_9AGAR|nr:hypothetical protein P691DRAFT_776972 [Macrolepiota fuliginosa MF-IS2]